jgi:hypothetical protein
MGQKTSSRGQLALRALSAACLCAPVAARAEDGVEIATPETLIAYGDARTVVVDGEDPWVDGGLGKLRYGRDPAADGVKIKPEFGEAGIVWQPRLGWALSGTVVALAQGNGDKTIEGGLSEAFLSFKPLGDGPMRISARAGFMWPPVSLEHSGPEWEVADTITPSAIGSWIGEEVKVVGAEVTGQTRIGRNEVSLTVAGFDLNDTAGALLTFRGWALHDRKALAFHKQPLPPLNDFMQYVQPRYSHPLLDLDGGLFKRPGYYAKLGWTLPVPVRIEAVHYDNNGDPLAVNADLEWGWRTAFTTLGLVADLGRGFELRAQGLTGTTRMGDRIGGHEWINMRYRAAYGMATHRFARGSVSARLDLFDTRNEGSAVDAADDETGWALTFAAKRELGRFFTALVEYLHVESDRDGRVRVGEGDDQAQNQLQMALRVHW